MIEHFSQKYGYEPDMDTIDSQLSILARDIDGAMTPEMLAACFGMMDLTSLKNNDTPSSICRMVEKADAFKKYYPSYPNPASVCVFSNFAPVVKACKKSEDIQIALNAFLDGDYERVYDELSAIRKAVDEAAASQGRTVILKAILETGLLVTPENIAVASFIAMEAGVDFIKTSTGKTEVSATPSAAYIMCECIRAFFKATGRKVGFKPAGGMTTGRDAACYYLIVSSVLGKEWLDKSLFRFGVSRMANNLLSDLEQCKVNYF